MPGSTRSVTVTMQAQKESPPDMQSKDKFLLQSVVAPDGTTTKEITSEMFNKEGDKVVEEFKLRVVYIPANPPSPVPEESDEGSSPPRPSVLENGNQDSSLLDAVSRTLEEPKEKSFETWSLISRLTEEKTSALQQNLKLQHELELMRKQISKKHAGGVSLLVVFLVGLFGILVGYIFK
ncbi:VESICLE-ASSOCIATED MEMBRANE PROTEIN-ASSOCIATED PROTEIN [Salix purpurea]|uniref:VESICLE-ASSOCIATED MEMBRANE PROTEIN-ASSOCIATED PROTEIN n=1 Tax=Salix purpurea TaxID=77065 RepID=A0A9Q0PD65_SALPP|nr:VESICLE-ASSOCIATED MEMBRANE PROTEIN-ASSOCIATED PROTEIN [Salix purpurea]